MEKLSNNREMVRKLSRVEDIFKTYEQLNEEMEATSAELEETKSTERDYSSVQYPNKITHKIYIYVIGIIICLIVGIVGYNITKHIPNYFVGTYSCNDDNTGVSLNLAVNPDNTFEFKSNVYDFEGTWNKAESDPNHTIELRIDDTYVGYLHWTSNVDGYPYVEIHNYGDYKVFENLDFVKGEVEVKPYLPLKAIIIIVILALLTPVCERASVKRHNRYVDSYIDSIESLKQEANELIPMLEEQLYSIESEMNDLAVEYQQDFADWYPPKYSYPEAAAYFRELFENSRATTMQEAMDRFEEYLYRNEMLRMQCEHKEMLTQQMELQMNTFNAVNENFAKLSNQIEADGAMTRATVVAEAESIKHKITEEANYINNNIAAEAAGINKNIKKHSPF